MLPLWRIFNFKRPDNNGDCGLVGTAQLLIVFSSFNALIYRFRLMIICLKLKFWIKRPKMYPVSGARCVKDGVY